MTIFDLIFIGAFLTTVILITRILWKLIRGNFQKAGRAALQLGIFLAVYMGALIIVSISTPQRVLRMGEDLCFDDWCIAVDDCSSSRNADQVRYFLNLRVSSRARRVSQRAPASSVYVTDSEGKKYPPSPEGQRAYESVHGEAKPLGDLLGPLESFSTVRVFDLPPESKDVGLVVRHGQGPGWLIIGESQSLFHKRTVTKLVCKDKN